MTVMSRLLMHVLVNVKGHILDLVQPIDVMFCEHN